MPTIKEVAHKAGVSTATVSRVINLSGYTSSDSTRRVQQAMQELDYSPNHTARSLRRQRTERVCLVIPQLGTPIYDEIVCQLQAAADANGCSVVISVGDTPERQRQIITQLRRGLADGVAFSYPDPAIGPEIARLAQSGVAVVVRSNQIEGKGFDIVRTNEGEAIGAAVRHFVGLGRRRIAFIGRGPDSGAHVHRMQSYLKALDELGLPRRPELILMDIGTTREQIYHNAGNLMKLPDPPDAVITGTDPIGLCAIRAAQDAGRRVPEDVAVIGIGNIAEGRISAPPLSTIGNEEENLGIFGQLLFSRLFSPQPVEDRVWLDTWGLILRGSA